MQKTRKQILGLAGLLAVGAMTAVACSLPAPSAAAANSGDNIDIRVDISEGDIAIAMISPLNDTGSVSPVVEVSSRYEYSSELEYFLSYTNDDGTETEISVHKASVSDQPSGVYTFNLDLNPYGYREYRLRAVARSGSSTREDSVAFSYSALLANFEGSDKNADPILGIELSSDVDKIRVQVYGENGKPLFVNADGDEEPVMLSRSDIDSATGKITTALPFAKYEAKPGEYTTVISGYRADGNILSMVTLDLKYPMDTPDTPNTGSTLFGGLNVSHIDYLITGLIAFAIAAGFAIYLVQRKNKTRR